VTLPVEYTLHDGSILFYVAHGTFAEEDLRTGIARAGYQVAVELDHMDPEARENGACWGESPDSEAERASIISARARAVAGGRI
jgi:hypothetical protein